MTHPHEALAEAAVNDLRIIVKFHNLTFQSEGDGVRAVCDCGEQFEAWPKGAPTERAWHLRQYDSFSEHLARTILAAGYVLADHFTEAVTEARAEGWAECIQEAEDCGWMHDLAADDMSARNPYRRADSLAPEAPSDVQQ